MIVGNAEYTAYRKLMERIKEVLEESQLEKPLIRYRLDLLGEKREMNGRRRERIIEESLKGFRCMVVHQLMGLSYRELSLRLAESPLLQEFCYLRELSQMKIPGKSKLQRYATMYPVELLKEVMDKLNELMSQSGGLNLSKAISLEDVYVDETCVEADIHFPVDWLLLRDATRTLMKAVALIRKKGLLNRMREPATFIRDMNNLTMNMTHAKDRKTKKKVRKETLRSMKKLAKKIESHAKAHLELLE